MEMLFSDAFSVENSFIKMKSHGNTRTKPSRRESVSTFELLCSTQVFAFMGSHCKRSEWMPRHEVFSKTREESALNQSSLL